MLHVVIMAGGRGTRFWPASRRKLPKPFLQVTGERTLLQLTVDRVLPLATAARVWLVIAAGNIAPAREQLPQLPAENFIGEPQGRNTAPCLAVAAELIRRRDPEAVLVALPADHIIEEEEQFRAMLAAAAAFAVREKRLVTIGIKPRFPHTGFGYIRTGGQLAAVQPWPVHAVRQFVEKPDRATAEGYLAAGDYAWNGGMFIVSAATWLDMVAQHLPALAAELPGLDAADLAPAYARMPAVSIDYGVLEKETRLACIPAALTWSDVGSWTALYERAGADNAALGPLWTKDAHGNYFHTPDKFVAALGVENLIVVDTGDALLVCTRDRAEEVKDIVAHLEQHGPAHLV
ncbi:MAG TPA: sugar phosphate nucleotidyltransferase [bacterium]|nr:sugar phosphate nucleotidyltransferase [bacterium]